MPSNGIDFTMPESSDLMVAMVASLLLVLGVWLIGTIKLITDTRQQDIPLKLYNLIIYESAKQQKVKQKLPIYEISTIFSL